jgi:hypothetical protein
MVTTSHYSTIDRLLHRVAFGGLAIQQAVADIEDGIYAKPLAAISNERPVFVTALARAGTTLLLETLYSAGGFAAHTYRQMPFVLCPIFWSQVTRGFRQSASLQERAHGDGVAINYDSPEAFDEIIWRHFWPRKYLADRIEVWTPQDDSQDFRAFFANHIRKIIFVHQQASPGQRLRYLSKNNTNIARLPLLHGLFSDSIVIVPVRNPADHVTSLLHQHRRFAEAHVEDPFSAQYMQWLGHFEFGNDVRPVNFGGWLDTYGRRDHDTREFWLAYWIAVHRALLSCDTPNVFFVDYDSLCREPKTGLEALAAAVQIDQPERLVAQAPRFRAPSQRPGRTSDEGPGWREAWDLHAALTERSIVAVAR